MGEIWDYSADRWGPDQADSYTDEDVRKIMRPVMPQLEKYRFLLKLDPPDDETIEPDDTIYECLPALWHYSVQRISRPIDEPVIPSVPNS